MSVSGNDVICFKREIRSTIQILHSAWWYKKKLFDLPFGVRSKFDLLNYAFYVPLGRCFNVAIAFINEFQTKMVLYRYGLPHTICLKIIQISLWNIVFYNVCILKRLWAKQNDSKWSVWNAFCYNYKTIT